MRGRLSLDNEQYASLLSETRSQLNRRYGFEFIPRIHDALIQTPVIEASEGSTKQGLDWTDFEFALRQECYARYAADDLLNASLLWSLASHRRVTIGLPSIWRRTLSEYGIETNSFRSALRWKLRCLAGLARGFAKGTLQVARLFRISEHRRSRNTSQTYLYLHAVAPENLPSGIQGLPPTDIVSWLERETDFLTDANLLLCNARSSVRVTDFGTHLKSSPYPLAIPSGTHASLRFIGRLLALAANLIKDLFSGQWETWILASQLVDKTVLEATQGSGQASVHLFNNSSALVRPLWSVVAPRYNIRSVCYFYSTNIEPRLYLPEADGGHVRGAWQLFWWDEAIVWDERHADFLSHTAIRSSNTRKVPPVTFVAATRKIHNFSRQIAVFDVTPFNMRKQATWTETLLYSPDVIEAFMTDIADVADWLGLDVAWKPKRELSSVNNAAYISLQESMLQRKNLRLLPVGVSAEQLIDKSCAAISIPFASTGLIASFRGKPSAFFDPSRLVPDQHPGAHHLPLFTSKPELVGWLAPFSSV